ncbi:MAG: radical SAM protein, partial [Betaproteobacteria bacterium]
MKREGARDESEGQGERDRLRDELRFARTEVALLRELSPVRSISIETNPNHLEPEVLRRYAAAGVTRLSVGVQSFDDG